MLGVAPIHPLTRAPAVPLLVVAVPPAPADAELPPEPDVEDPPVPEAPVLDAPLAGGSSLHVARSQTLVQLEVASAAPAATSHKTKEVSVGARIASHRIQPPARRRLAA